MTTPMKRHLQLIYIITLCLTAMLASCGPVKDCDEVGQNFYQSLREGDINKALQYLDPEALNQTPEDIWRQGLMQKSQDLGMILNIERNDFESETSNNVTHVTIKYKIHYSKATMFERLEFVERDSKYRITFYKYDEDSTMVN